MISALKSISLAILLASYAESATHHRYPSKRSTHNLQTRQTTSYSSNWWSWNSEEGYKSGSGTPPTIFPALHKSVQTYSKPKQPSSTAIESYSSGPINHQTPKAPDNVHSNLPITQPSSGSDAQRWLEAHNQVRAKYLVSKLEWSEHLVASAKVLADTCRWKHSTGIPYGENMSAGQSSPEEVVDGWVNGLNEKESYSPSNPNYSHFTQVVWRDTKTIGCTNNTCITVEGSGLPQSPVLFWVCQYDPPGNVISKFGDNVKARQGGAPAVDRYSS